MILSITPNPAIDRTIILPGLVPGHVHRAERVIVVAGGKGLNVARAIRTLGGDPFCMGFAGGHAGHLLADLAQSEGLRFLWTWVNRETRTCLILVPPDGDGTVINEPGAPVASTDWKQLQNDVQQFVSSANTVCISGSLPPNSSAEALQGLMSMFIDAALGFEVKDPDSARRALIRLGEHRLAASVITLGSAGALLVTREGSWHAQEPR